MKNLLKSVLIKTLPNMELARFMSYLPKIREFDFSGSKFFEKKYDMYAHINKEFVGAAPVSYLEFGVFKGASIKYWVEINNNPQSEFVGFDTFTGLPENWYTISGTLRKNHFDTNGVTPEVGDKRCSFVKGMFQDTLEDFLKGFKPKEKLVIHNDSDLYSSTLYTLAKLHPFLKPGSIIIFDEFSSPLHEMRAINDFSSSHLYKYKIICHTTSYRQVAIQTLA